MHRVAIQPQTIRPDALPARTGAPSGQSSGFEHLLDSVTPTETSPSRPGRSNPDTDRPIPQRQSGASGERGISEERSDPVQNAKKTETDQADSGNASETGETDSEDSNEIENGEDDASYSEHDCGSDQGTVSPDELLTPIADEQESPDALITLDVADTATPSVALPGAPAFDTKHSEHKSLPDLPDIAIARAAAISRPGALRTGDAGSDPTLAAGEAVEAEGAIPAAKFDAPAAPTQAASELPAEMPEAPAADSKPSDIAKILKPETPVEKPDAPTVPLPDKVTAAPPISSNRPSTDMIEKGKPDEPNEKAAEAPARETVAANRTEHPLPAQAQNQTVKPDNAQAVGFTLASNVPALDIQRLDLTPQTPLQAAFMQSDDPAVPIQGLAVEFAARALAGKNRFEIRLDPPELGRIDVRLEVDSEGNVQSRMVVERIETLDLLRRDAPQLERALQQAGLKTGENGLEFSLRDQSLPQRERSPNEQPRLFIPDEDLGPVDLARNYGRIIGLGSGIDIRV